MKAPDGHSIFAYQLLKELTQNDRPYLSTQELYTRIAPIVGNNSEQTPLCSPIRNTGDQGGEFIFVASMSRPAPRKARLFVDITPTDARVRILNIGPAFYPGMELNPGRYHLEASADGYKTEERWVSLQAGEDEALSMRLAAVNQPVVDRKAAWNNVDVPPGGQSHHYYSITNPVNCAITITHITKSASAPSGVSIDYGGTGGQSYDLNYPLAVGKAVGTQIFFNVSDNAQCGTMISNVSFDYTSNCGSGSRSASGSTKVICLFCGDGAVNLPGEECDDGNKIVGDGCSPDCKIEQR